MYRMSWSSNVSADRWRSHLQRPEHGVLVLYMRTNSAPRSGRAVIYSIISTVDRNTAFFSALLFCRDLSLGMAILLMSSTH